MYPYINCIRVQNYTILCGFKQLICYFATTIQIHKLHRTTTLSSLAAQVVIITSSGAIGDKVPIMTNSSFSGTIASDSWQVAVNTHSFCKKIKKISYFCIISDTRFITSQYFGSTSDEQLKPAMETVCCLRPYILYWWNDFLSIRLPSNQSRMHIICIHVI